MSGRRRPTRERRADLSQHFLEEARAAKLIRATSIDRSDLVIEIGAGRGALTRPLARRAGRVIAVEIDPYLAHRLRDGRAGRAEVVTGDFLSLPLPDGPYKVVGNLPYAIGTAIVRRLTEGPNPPGEAWLIVQREAAERLCGRPYLPESLSSLKLKPAWHLEITQRLRRTDFDPPPAVDSVLLRLAHRSRPLLAPAESERFVGLVDAALRHGGSIRQALGPRLSKVQVRRLAGDLRFHPDDRPPSLCFEQWLGIYRFLQAIGADQPPASSRKRRSSGA